MRRSWARDASTPSTAEAARPILGVLGCLVLMLSLPAQNWLRLAAWLAVGLVVYFAYGRHHRQQRRLDEPR